MSEIHVLTPDCPFTHLWQQDNQFLGALHVEGAAASLDLLHRLPQRGLAVVGTREPNLRSRQLTDRSIRALAGSDLIVLSGFARGIDACAHEAALQARLPTVAIVGAGLDFDYPRENADLRRRIVANGGLVISMFPHGTGAHKWNFLERNRLIAIWSQATWVVQAGVRSGALNTASWARENDRRVYSTPSFPGETASLGNQVLLDRDEATSFWGPHSLGSTWLELASASSRPGQPAAALPGDRDEGKLGNYVREATLNHGGISPQLLLSWAVGQGWSPARFFAALTSAIGLKWIRDEHGVLVR